MNLSKNFIFFIRDETFFKFLREKNQKSKNNIKQF